MRRVWLTARYEMRSVLTRRSFWITTFVLPAGLVLVVLLIQAFSGGGDAQTGLPGVASDAEAIGYVDQTGVLAHRAGRPSPRGSRSRYPSEAEATAALQQGDIDRYYVVPADYVASGRLTVVQARYQPLRAVSSGELMTYVLNTGIGGDERLARLLLDPTPVVQIHGPGPGRHRRARQRGGQLPAALPADVHPLPGPRHVERLHAAERLAREGEPHRRDAPRQPAAA